jgi:hypothetical protein
MIKQRQQLLPGGVEGAASLNPGITGSLGDLPVVPNILMKGYIMTYWRDRAILFEDTVSKMNDRLFDRYQVSDVIFDTPGIRPGTISDRFGVNGLDELERLAAASL